MTQEQLSSNSLPIATIHIVQNVPVSRSTGRARATNAAKHKRQRAIQVVATHPASELSISIEHDIHQQANTSSKRSTVESRFNVFLRSTRPAQRCNHHGNIVPSAIIIGEVDQMLGSAAPVSASNNQSVFDNRITHQIGQSVRA